MRALALPALLAAAACSGGGSSGPEPFVLQWSPALTAAPVPASGGTSSSTRLAFSWNPPSNLAVARYDVAVRESGAATTRVVSTASTSQTIGDLKSATTYLVSVRACDTTATCHDNPSAPLTVQTPAEVWQLQGAGRTLSGLTRIVPDGNVKIHALRLGEDAPAGLVGRLRLYYGASGPNVRGLAAAVTTEPANASNPASYRSFTSRAGSAGLVDPAAPSLLVRAVATGQAVALSAALGGRVRLYFEALGADNRTRIVFVDSHDGYAGLDFNAGSASTCSTAADYSPGGGCAPTLVIGSEGDPTHAWPKILNARQFKIGVPTATDWRWDGAAGSFMVFTTDAIPGCSTASHNQAYAVWNGTAWQVQYQADGCPRLLASAQAAHPLHLGGVRYKLYYGDPSDSAGRVAGSPLPFLGPKKLLYADGAATGDASRVDFEDWEPVALGRALTFLWPDGTPLDAAAEGYIDDFTVLAPTGAAALQVMYLAITDGTVIPFAAAAVLANP